MLKKVVAFIAILLFIRSLWMYRLRHGGVLWCQAGVKNHISLHFNGKYYTDLLWTSYLINIFHQLKHSVYDQSPFRTSMQD